MGKKQVKMCRPMQGRNVGSLWPNKSLKMFKLYRNKLYGYGGDMTQT